jgi:hypothetical protein
MRSCVRRRITSHDGEYQVFEMKDTGSTGVLDDDSCNSSTDDAMSASNSNEEEDLDELDE